MLPAGEKRGPSSENEATWLEEGREKGWPGKTQQGEFACLPGLLWLPKPMLGAASKK